MTAARAAPALAVAGALGVYCEECPFIMYLFDLRDTLVKTLPRRLQRCVVGQLLRFWDEGGNYGKCFEV